MQPIEVLPETLLPRFSYYKRPITNVVPCSTITIFDAYTFIRDVTFSDRLLKLRTIENVDQAKQYKRANFDYVTFSGIFEKRKDDKLIQHSGLITIDLDDLDEPELVKKILLKDDNFETALLFCSPSGDGLKWIVEIDISECSHTEYFQAISNYLKVTYRIKVDPSGKDVSRACFIPHDRECFINPKFYMNYEK
jgi:hypothetical protein